MTDLLVVRFGDGDGESPHDREQARIRPRYVDLVGRATGLDAALAERVIAAIFDRRSADGRACVCATRAFPQPTTTASIAPARGMTDAEPNIAAAGRRGTKGFADDLGDTPVAHLDFIVHTIRDRLWADACEHEGALFYCPLCGTRM